MTAPELRVMHVVEAFGGGVFEQICALCNRLPAHGVRTAVAYGRRPETPTEVRDRFTQQVELFPLQWGARRGFRELVKLRELRTAIGTWQPDLVHLHSSFAGLVGSILTPARIPSVYTPHGYSFTMRDRPRLARAGFRVIERSVARRVTAIGAVSAHEADLASEMTSPEDVFVIENGIPELDLPATCAAERGSSRRPSVVAMGRLAPQHQPEQAAAILGAVADIASVRWVGDGAVPSCRAPMDRARIRVTGWLEREDAIDQLRRASIYLHWAAWDGLPLAVLEAMAMDTVVVAADIPAIRGIVPAPQCVRTPQDAISTIRLLIADPARYRQALRAQSEVRARHGAQRMTARWAALYHRLACGEDLICDEVGICAGADTVTPLAVG
jgi:glycosyltransferase involved in cell wall biosynthesis